MNSPVVALNGVWKDMRHLHSIKYLWWYDVISCVKWSVHYVLYYSKTETL